ncbi:hypothetical protein [Trichloromonas sp.]|uniref:hypothetical protein n=1 Tax=Trichloromonas sp. TaxID=3069249 RepID=UPI002A437C5C|nr:hypothetical protein [Trichloromonas sp.]
MSSAPSLQLPLGLRLWPPQPGSPTPIYTEGYVFGPLENTTDSYRFSIMVDADRIPGLLAALVARLPEEMFFILEYYDNEAAASQEENPAPTIYYSPYLPTAEILEAIESYLPRLIHDGFVGFGLANNREGIEIFYSEEKVLTCFTGNHLRITDLLESRGIRHDPHLLFPTDSGHDHLSLMCLPRRSLPAPFAEMSDSDLDYACFCEEIGDLLDMYPVADDFAFFLSKKEQDQIEALLIAHPDYEEFAEEDFGGLLLDWSDFVSECVAGFEGDLWEYRQGLRLRDLIEFVISETTPALAEKIREIVAESDERLRENLVDRRKRLDPPEEGAPTGGNLFWYQGIVRNQGAPLRRDLIRQGWYQS